MANPKIVVNQGALPPGVPGFAREDMSTGTDATVAVVGGPYLEQLWSWVDRPIDMAIPAQSSASFADPTAPTTNVSPVDLVGTYFLQVLVDQGFGLGARPEDASRLTFYAGDPAVPLNPVWDDLPRRVPAFAEQREHNPQDDPIFGLLGNLRGWAQEWVRWFGVIARLRRTAITAWGYVELDPSGATFVYGSNVAGAVRNSEGRVTVTLATPSSSGAAIAIAFPFRDVGGTATCSSNDAADFVFDRADPFGVYCDGNFAFVIVGP